MRPWEQFQHETADLLTDLRFKAVVNDRLIGANGAVHAIDVSARRVLAGVNVLWIVECKQWNRRIPMERVGTLQAIVDDLGADRGLLISEKGFQSGAYQMARAKNITLSSMAYFRENAAEELLIARVTAGERRLLNLMRRSTRGLRTFGPVVPHLLPALAEQLTAEDRAEFAARTAAVDFREGMAELAGRIGDANLSKVAPAGLDPAGIRRSWRGGVDPSAMETIVSIIGHLNQALNQGRLGDFPVVVFQAPGEPKLAWSMAQLVGVLELGLTSLEQAIAAQEARATC